MICSLVNLLFLMSAILLVGGLLLLQVGTAGGGQVSQTTIATPTHGKIAFGSKAMVAAMQT